MTRKSSARRLKIAKESSDPATKRKRANLNPMGHDAGAGFKPQMLYSLLAYNLKHGKRKR